MLLLLTPLLLAASQATFDEVVRGLESDGYYVEPGSEPVDTGALAQAVRDSDVGLRPVILADSAVDGEQQLADDILDDLGAGTVVVVSPSNIGVSTDRADDRQVEAALDSADAETDSVTDLVGYLEAFDQALADADSNVLLGSIILIALAVLVVVGLVLLVKNVRRRRQDAERRERAVQEARAEVGSQISAVADHIVDLHGRVEMAGEGDASRLYAAAAETYTQAQRHLEQSTSPTELERVADELDRARWQLESVTALLDGREPPPEPERKAACFFDPNHGAGTHEAKLDTPVSTVDRDIRVCRDCASKLEAGDAPQPRMVGFDGRQVPVAKAPRAYGGGGYGYVDDFTIVLGERRYPYQWGSYHTPYDWWDRYGGARRRRSWFGGSSGGGWGSGGWRSGGWGSDEWGSGGWGSGGSRPYRRRSRWSSSSRSSGSWSSGGSGSVSRGSASRSRSVSRGGGSRSRSVSRGGGSRSRSVSRGGGSRSRSSGRRGGGSRRR